MLQNRPDQVDRLSEPFFAEVTEPIPYRGPDSDDPLAFRWYDADRDISGQRLEDALVIASRSEISKGKFEDHEGWFREIRPMGSIAWKLACIASGEGDLTVSFAPKNEWDVCAGDLLVREAGGAYLSFEGQRRLYNQADPHMEWFMAAGPQALVEAFRARETLRLQRAPSS